MRRSVLFSLWSCRRLHRPFEAAITGTTWYTGTCECARVSDGENLSAADGIKLVSVRERQAFVCVCVECNSSWTRANRRLYLAARWLQNTVIYLFNNNVDLRSGVEPRRRLFVLPVLQPVLDYGQKERYERERFCLNKPLVIRWRSNLINFSNRIG